MVYTQILTGSRLDSFHSLGYSSLPNRMLSFLFLFLRRSRLKNLPSVFGQVAPTSCHTAPFSLPGETQPPFKAQLKCHLFPWSESIFPSLACLGLVLSFITSGAVERALQFPLVSLGTVAIFVVICNSFQIRTCDDSCQMGSLSVPPSLGLYS